MRELACWQVAPARPPDRAPPGDARPAKCLTAVPVSPTMKGSPPPFSAEVPAMNDIPRLFAPPPPAYGSRREFLARAGGGFGMLALAGLLGRERLLAEAPVHNPNPLAPHPGHHPARAKSVIWLF